MSEPEDVDWPPPSTADSVPADSLLSDGAGYAAQFLTTIARPNDLSDATKIMFADALATVELAATMAGIHDQLARLARVAEALEARSGPLARMLGDLAESAGEGQQPLGRLASAVSKLADLVEERTAQQEW